MPKIVAKKEDWIKLGYQLFADRGLAGIVIEKMAATLKVNKSSFYWHFSTKKEFVEQIVSFWVTEDTLNIIDQVNQEKSPAAQFEKLVELSFKKEPFMDFFFYLKKYAQSQKELQALIDTIDHQRVAFTQNLLVNMGFSEEHAAIKSQLFYKYLIGYHEMIRYKKQPRNYLAGVKLELDQFIQY